MGLEEYLNDRCPFRNPLGIEITEFDDAHGVPTPHGEAYLERPSGGCARGVVFTLADSVSAAALMSKHETATPTGDIGIEYYAPATSDLYAQGEIVKDGATTRLVHVDVEDGDGTTSRA